MILARGTVIRKTSIVLASLPVLVLAGCGIDTGSPVVPTHTAKKSAVHTRVSTQVPVGQSTPLPVQATLIPSPIVPTLAPTRIVAHVLRTVIVAPTAPVLRPTTTPASTIAPAILPPRLLYASVRPDSVLPGGTLTAFVSTTGTVSRVDVYVGSGAPTASPPVTYSLSESTPGSWTAQGRAPMIPGPYHFSVGLFDHAGVRHMVDNDAFTVEVAGATSVSSPPTVGLSPPQTIPADIPLSPPFAYGSPQPAVFSAAGSSVSGSEVSSTSRATIAPSIIANWYINHLPRAGWNVDPTTIPAAGAAEFSIAASSGSGAGMRVCVVQYTGGTVHIFYGTVSR